MSVPALRLNNGRDIPVVGLGTWQAPDDEVEKAVRIALDVGYRLIDTAWYYGNESGVGAAVRGKVQEGVVKREDICVTTKLWNSHHSVENVVPCCRESLGNLGLDYIDLYLVHWPFGFKSVEGVEIRTDYGPQDLTPLEDVWREMEKCVELGLVKSIGLSNFNKSQIQRILDVATVKPVINQIECHMLLNQKPLIEFCRSKNILVEGYSPFCSPTRPHATQDDKNILQDERILEVADKHGKTAGQVVLRYLVQLGIVVIPKSVTPERIRQNLDIFDFELSDQDMFLLSVLDIHQRHFPYEEAKDHPEYPFYEDF